MPFITAQKAGQYYDDYRDIQVTFTREVAKVIGFQPSKIYLKCGGEQYPCIVYSTSMKNSKLVMKIDSMFVEKLNAVNKVASLRFCFIEDEKGKLVSFFVPGKIAEYSQYDAGGKNDLYLVNFEFSKRPAEDLIGTIGRLLEINIASKKRKEVRLDLDEALLSELTMPAKSVKLDIEGVPRMGIMRDISFGGTRIIISGIAKFLLEKKVVLHLQTNLEIRNIAISGIIKRTDKVEGRKDLTVIAIQFDEKAIPMCLKTKLNDAMEKRGL